jgi:hypothetical protein
MTQKQHIPNIKPIDGMEVFLKSQLQAGPAKK